MSPFEALYEYKPPALSELPVVGNLPEGNPTLAEKENILALLQKNMEKAQRSMKKYADAKRTDRTFAIGDMVYIKMQPHREHALGSGNPLKLASKWYGPFRILHPVGQRAFKIQLPAGIQLHDVFHVNQLKKHIGPQAVPNPSVPFLTPDGKIKTHPISILQYRQVPRYAGSYDVAIPQWLIHWEGMTPSEATWEDADFVQRTFPSFKP